MADSQDTTKKSKQRKPKRGDGIFMRHGNFYMSWMDANGNRIKRACTHAENLEQAREERAEHLRKVRHTQVYGITPPTDKTFAAVAAEYLAKQKHTLTNSAYLRAADIVRLHLAPAFDSSLASVNVGKVLQYVSRRQREVSASTACKELNLLKDIFRFSVISEYLPANPAADVRGPEVKTKEQGYFTTEQFEALLLACPEWLRPIVGFGFATGIRLGNILSLAWENVDLQKGWLHLPETKNGDPLNVPLNQLAIQVLMSLAIAKKGLVFGYSGKHNRASVAFKRAVVKAGLPSKLHFHNLRHSFCAHSLMSGNDAITVQKQLGQRTGSMTSRYAHLSPEFMRGAAARMDAAFSGLKIGDAKGTITPHMLLHAAPLCTTTNTESTEDRG